jgi:hypothetical protein
MAPLVVTLGKLRLVLQTAPKPLQTGKEVSV